MFGAVSLGLVSPSSLASWSANIKSSLSYAPISAAIAFTFCCRYLAHTLCLVELSSNSIFFLQGNFPKNSPSRTCPISVIIKSCFWLSSHLDSPLSCGRTVRLWLFDSSYLSPAWPASSLSSCLTALFLLSLVIISNFEISNWFRWRFHPYWRSSTTPFLLCVLDVSKGICEILLSML